MLDAEFCYRALAARDARFDGQFFTGVATTGIFCRPVCPARTPLKKNCAFYASAAAAMEAGYRPCLRCRPEVSPELPAWQGTAAAVGRALKLIHAGALDDEGGGGVEELAARVGLGDRQLRRLFEEHLGASPVAVAQARRLLFAKRLISETRLPLTEVALAAGFGSVRRFNHVFLRSYGRSPREMRREGEPAAATEALELRLWFRPPYDWDGLAGFLSKRAIPGVEEADAAGYARTIRSGGGKPGRIRVSPAGGGVPALRLRVELESVTELRQVTERVARMFDAGAEPEVIAARLGAAVAVPGVRIPGAWDPFELAVRAILGQQVSVAAATTMAARLVERWGTGTGLGGTPSRLFPTPDELARAEVAEIGLPKARAAAITNLARAVADGEFSFDRIGSGEAAVRALCELKGIGPWTAEYIAMRAHSEPDAFPAGDLVLRQAMGMISEARLREAAEAWRPWRAYAAFSLWQRAAGQEKKATKERAR